MKKSLSVFAAAVVWSVLGFASSAQAYIVASPSFYNFGSVPAGSQDVTTIWFNNYDKDPVSNFWVSCNDPSGEFYCSSSCTYIPANGSCPVTVYFQPRRGDNGFYTVQIVGRAPRETVYATAQGIDLK